MNDDEPPRALGPTEVAGDVVFGRGCVLGGSEGPTVIEDGCRLGDFVRLDGGVTAGRDSQFGDFVRIGHPTKAETTGADVSATSERVRDLLIASPTAHIGANSVVRSHTVIYNHVRLGPNLSTGHHALIREHTVMGARCVFGTGALCDGYTRIGDDVQVGHSANLAQAARIGNGVFIGASVILSDNRHAVRSLEHDLFGAVIEDFVRLGIQSVVLSGVRIGHDTIVGASSVVTKDIPPGVVAFGSPCRVIRDLRPDEIAAYRGSVMGPIE